MRVLPGTLLFDALKSAFRESLRSRFFLAFHFFGFTKINARHPAAFRLIQTGATVFIDADKHRFRQRYLTARRAPVSAYLRLEPQ